MHRYAIIAMALLSGCAHQDPWTSDDTDHFIAYTVSVAFDVHSTNRLIKRYPDVSEHNPIVSAVIGSRPNTNKLVVGAIVVSTVNFFVARALPSRYRRKYLTLWTFGHIILAVNNVRLFIECTGPVYCNLPAPLVPPAYLRPIM